MNCAQAREHLPELIDNRLPAGTAADIRRHLEECPACRHEFETLSLTLRSLDALPEARPSQGLRARVLASIEAEKKALREDQRRPAAPSSRPFPGVWRIGLQVLGACTLVAAGYFAGAHRAPPAAEPAADATARQLAELKSRMDSMGQLVSYTLLQQQKSSANDRLETVLTSAELPHPSEKVIDNLVSTLVLDPSVNCRLSAVDALYAHADSEVVRTAIRVSLPREQSPLVQLSMIDFLAAVRDRDAAPAFQKISTDSLADPSVRAAAARALAQL
jgi:anti-sigma factor RsiW